VQAALPAPRPHACEAPFSSSGGALAAPASVCRKAPAPVCWKRRISPRSKRPESQQANENIHIVPEKNIGPPWSWLIRWLFPVLRIEESFTAPAPGLAVNFWTGGPPQVHTIRDVSATGLYVVTAERWVSGTQVRLTLTNTDSEEQPLSARSPWKRGQSAGHDGVGLEFVLQEAQKLRRGRPSTFSGVDSKQLDQF